MKLVYVITTSYGDNETVPMVILRIVYHYHYIHLEQVEISFHRSVLYFLTSEVVFVKMPSHQKKRKAK